MSPTPTQKCPELVSESRLTETSSVTVSGQCLDPPGFFASSCWRRRIPGRSQQPRALHE